MSSYTFKFCLILVIGAVMCASEKLQCTDGENDYSPNCIIYNAHFTEVTEFQLRNNHNYKYQITRLKFMNSSFSYIPHGVFTKLPMLERIDFRHCRILKVERLDFVNATNLIVINLSYNRLTVLRDSIFYGANFVQEINLSYNEITLVSNSTFQNLNYLQKIDLSFNRIKKIASSVFTNLVALRYLKLTANSIASITAEDSYTNMNLTELDLSINSIVSIDPKAFLNTIFIKSLDLSFNAVQKLNFSDVAINIDTLKIYYNVLTELQTNNNLRILDASNNQLTETNLIITENLLKLTLNNNLINNFNFLKPLTKLTNLGMSFNQLDNNLEPDTFTQLIQLKTLHLKSVNLKKIDFQIFSELQQLLWLDISYNDLESINFHVLQYVGNIYLLQINGNRLTQLNLDDFTLLFPSLGLIDISDNNWRCSDLSDILKRSEQLNVKVYEPDSDKMVKNETNIRGIQCNDEDATSVANLSTTPINLETSITQTHLLDTRTNMQNSNLTFKKILLVAFFVIGMVLGALILYRKCYRTYQPTHNTTYESIV